MRTATLVLLFLSSFKRRRTWKWHRRMFYFMTRANFKSTADEKLQTKTSKSWPALWSSTSLVQQRQSWKYALGLSSGVTICTTGRTPGHCFLRDVFSSWTPTCLRSFWINSRSHESNQPQVFRLSSGGHHSILVGSPINCPVLFVQATKPKCWPLRFRNAGANHHNEILCFAQSVFFSHPNPELGKMVPRPSTTWPCFPWPHLVDVRRNMRDLSNCMVRACRQGQRCGFTSSALPADLTQQPHQVFLWCSSSDAFPSIWSLPLLHVLSCQKSDTPFPLESLTQNIADLFGSIRASAGSSVLIMAHLGSTSLEIGVQSDFNVRASAWRILSLG